MSQYYCVVAKDHQFHEIEYSNINDPNAFLKNVELSYFETMLTEKFDIVLPEKIRDEVLNDFKWNIANRVLNHGEIPRNSEP